MIRLGRLGCRASRTRSPLEEVEVLQISILLCAIVSNTRRSDNFRSVRPTPIVHDARAYRNRIFKDYCNHIKFVRDSSARLRKSGDETLPCGYFFRDIVASYRLLFGQDKASMRVFKEDLARKSEQEKKTLRADPLFLDLCGKDWSKQAVYDELYIPNVRTVYTASIGFPFFKQQLINFQEYAVTQQPIGWEGLWRDGRDPVRFWCLVVVIVFGISSIVIGLIQILVGGLQLGNKT